MEKIKNMQIFQYGQKEIEYLKRKDKKLGAAIDKIGMIKREITPEPFICFKKVWFVMSVKNAKAFF